jgi:hypothetical protein
MYVWGVGHNNLAIAQWLSMTYSALKVNIKRISYLFPTLETKVDKRNISKVN